MGFMRQACAYSDAGLPVPKQLLDRVMDNLLKSVQHRPPSEIIELFKEPAIRGHCLCHATSEAGDPFLSAGLHCPSAQPNDRPALTHRPGLPAPHPTPHGCKNSTICLPEAPEPTEARAISWCRSCMPCHCRGLESPPLTRSKGVLEAGCLLLLLHWATGPFERLDAVPGPSPVTTPLPVLPGFASIHGLHVRTGGSIWSSSIQAQETGSARPFEQEKLLVSQRLCKVGAAENCGLFSNVKRGWERSTRHELSEQDIAKIQAYMASTNFSWRHSGLNFWHPCSN
eukprot:jgi/Botrbrau1/3356/Bobra.0048s0050.1